MLIQALHAAWYLGRPEIDRTAARLDALSLPEGTRRRRSSGSSRRSCPGARGRR
ncbi:hypothetical protein ACFQX6_43520 [Streptosporangium lutulentum]